MRQCGEQTVKANTFKNKDRRKDFRVPVRLRVDETARTLSFYYSYNISRSGIFLETKIPLDIGVRVFLEFSLPDGGESIRVWGRTIWVGRGDGKGTGDAADAPAGMGVAFENLGEDDQSRLDAYIESTR